MVSARTPLKPPEVPWSNFEPVFLSRWEQGQHCLFLGPTGSGKTVCCRVLSRRRNFCVVLGTKPRDPELDNYLAEGYERIESWPPPRRLLTPRAVERNNGVRVVLWPKITSREQLVGNAPIYAKALDEILIQGGWTVIADEGLWLSSKLKLGDHLEAIAYGGRSSEITLMMLAQRPRGIPVNTWTNPSHLFLWHLGNTNDVRDLASLGVYSSKDVQLVIDSWAAEDGHYSDEEYWTPGAAVAEESHEFLYLPSRSGRRWAISEVDLEAIAA